MNLKIYSTELLQRKQKKVDINNPNVKQINHGNLRESKKNNVVKYNTGKKEMSYVIKMYVRKLYVK